MSENQEITIISHQNLIPTVLSMHHEGYRIVQICATRLETGFEITYSFSIGYKMSAIRLIISDDTEIMSISSVFEPAFLYENEMKDLFGVKIKHISLDFGGNFYRTEQKHPFK